MFKIVTKEGGSKEILVMTEVNKIILRKTAEISTSASQVVLSAMSQT